MAQKMRTYGRKKSSLERRTCTKKIKAAVDARQNKELLIIARTDARAVNGLEDALDRANSYVEAGADMIFVEAPQTIEELQEVPKHVKDVPP